jgi:hypothetical protein
VFRNLALLAVAALALGAGPALAAERVAMPLDGEITVGGVGVGCTGIGQTKDDPRWLTYPVRIEFSNPRREYLADADVDVATARGRPLVSVSCEGAWVLLRLPPGTYSVRAKLNNSKTPAANTKVRARAHGQVRAVVVFPDN